MSVEVPDELLYTEKHEWINPDTGWVGITDFAQQELGDVVYVELPEPGKPVETGDAIIVVESVKSVSDVYSPVSGTIEEVNDVLEQAPETVNDAPYEDGRMARIDAEGNLEHLMDASGYKSFV